MSRVKLVSLLSALLFGIILNCTAAESAKLVAMEFTGAVQSDKHGAFDYMLQDIAQQLALPLEYEVFVPARGVQIFLNGQADCLVPSADYAPYFTGTPVIHSTSFATGSFTAFTVNTPVIKQISDLERKIVGMIRDNNHWNYASHMANANIKFVGVNDLATLVKMLYLGRIDAAVHDRGDFLLQASRLNFAAPNHDVNSPLWSEKIVITCHDNPANRDFLTRINPQISAILQSKKMNEYYSRVAQRGLKDDRSTAQ